MNTIKIREAGKGVMWDLDVVLKVYQHGFQVELGKLILLNLRKRS